MKRIRLALLLALLPLFASCESTLDYGYYVNGFDAEAVEALFAIADEAANQMDFVTYSGLFGPNYSSVDTTDGSRSHTTRADYLEMVEGIFKSASYVGISTLVTDIEFVEPGRKAIVKTQEEQLTKQFGETTHLTSLFEVTVGYEDGWIFFERSEMTAQQVIEQ